MAAGPQVATAGAYKAGASTVKKADAALSKALQAVGQQS